MKTMPEIRDERSLVIDAFNRLKKESIQFVCCEVPLLGRCIDLAFMVEESLFSVEFKLHNWRKAIQQARDHRLGADFAYICMPEREVTSQMRDEFNEAGVGLMFYKKSKGWPFKEIIKAPKSKETWSVARSDLTEYIQCLQEI